MGLEGFHVYGKFLHVQRLFGGVKHQGVPVHQDREVWKFVQAAIKGRQEKGCPDIVPGRNFFFLADARRIQLPLSQDFQGTFFLRFHFRKGQRSALAYVFQDKPVAELVCYKHRIPLLEGLQESISGVFTLALGAQGECRCQKNRYDQS